jgi:aminopeptidase S
MRGGRMLVGVVGVVAVAGVVLSSPSMAGPAEVPTIAVEDVLPHLEKLQSIADETGGNRVAGSDGYAKSVDYVESTLANTGFTVRREKCDNCTEPDESVIADWPGGDEQATIMFGAHLDSVAEGPGIEDNGTGTAALLQIALTLAKTAPEMAKHVRFAWWSNEEQDSDSSTYYVEKNGTDDLAAYVNLDMTAAPNPGYFLTYVDDVPGKAVAEYLATAGAAAEEMDAGCDCSDDAAFDEAGVPTTYLTTASNDSDTMSAEQAEKWGGKAGEPFDECYHSACDAYPDNVHNDALGHTTNATLHALWTLAVQQ